MIITMDLSFQNKTSLDGHPDPDCSKMFICRGTKKRTFKRERF